MGIGEARRRSRDLRGEVRRGADPIALRREAARAKRQKAEEDALTLAVLVGQWETEHLSKRSDRYRREAVRALKLAFDTAWTKAAAHLDRAAVRRALDALGRRKVSRGLVGDRAAIQARTAAYGRACFAFATKRELVPANPFENLPLRESAPARDRVLTDAELGEVLNAIEAETTYGRIVRLLAATGQRANEVAGVRWQELSEDLRTWTIPAARAKNNETHVVPLSAAARLALDGLERPKDGKRLVFPSAAGTVFSAWGKSKAALDNAISAARAKKAGKPAGGAEPIEPWRIHDLRRTLATGLQRLGVRLEVTEAVLNHRSGSRAGIVGVYQRHDYAEEKRAALDVWGAKVEALLSGEAPGSNVVELRRAG